jgi:hydroxymethylpyrimidine pyrophosphatase-like HAD family hydrolase
MIIASDLDRTLFYSIRAIEELGIPTSSKLKPIEQKDHHWIAFMTESAYISLKALSQRCLFIPVTTRTIEQFKRFFIFEREIPLSYAITSNGAHILYKGEPLKEWSEHVSTRIRLESVFKEELLSLLAREGLYFEGQIKQAENLFFYFILNSFPPAVDKKAINEFVTKYGWRISLQGRKLYFLPRSISKGTALEFICNREGRELIAGAGDSLLDWDFLQMCRYRFVPRHGELASLAEAKGLTFTKKDGVVAGEEILQQFLELLTLKV